MIDVGGPNQRRVAFTRAVAGFCLLVGDPANRFSKVTDGDSEFGVHAANASFSSFTITLRSLPKTFDARAKPPSFVKGVRSKLSRSISRLVAMWSRIIPSH